MGNDAALRNAVIWPLTKLIAPSWPGPDPAIGYPRQIANDAVPVSIHPKEMTRPGPAMTGVESRYFRRLV